MILIQITIFFQNVPSMVFLPSYGYIVAMGKLWNMEGTAHTRQDLGTVYSPTLWKGNMPQTSEGIQLPFATQTEP